MAILKQDENAEALTADVLPVIQVVSFPDAATMLQRNADLLRMNYTRERFPSGGGILFSNQLLGVPFCIVSDIRYGVRPVKAGEDEATGRTWGAYNKNIANCMVVILDVETGTFGPPRLAELGGAYVIKALQNLTPNEQRSSRVWTLRRNDTGDWDKTSYGWPVGLATFDIDLDSPPDEVRAVPVPRDHVTPRVALPAAQNDVDEKLAYEQWRASSASQSHLFADEDAPAKRPVGRPRGSGR
jgi:hypothetical protein